MNIKRIVKKVSSLTARFAVLVATVGTVIAASIVMAFAEGYTVTDLGTLPGGTSIFANSINNSGQVVGWCYTATSDQRAVLFSNGTVTDLGYGDATSINNCGQVVGDTGNYAFLYSNQKVLGLGVLPGYVSSWAESINDSGQVVGYSHADNGVDRAVLFLPSGRRWIANDLGTLPGGTDSYANSINNYGQAAGESNAADGNMHATLFSNGTVTDLGTLPGYVYSYATSINNSGQVVGIAQTYLTYRAALFSNGTVTDLGVLPGYVNSYATSINNSGQAVGYSSLAYSDDHATLFSNGTVTDLNSLVDATLGWQLYAANGINDSGQIVGNGYINGQDHAFLLTPESTPTPIPASLSLFGSGLILLGILRRRRKKSN